MLKPQQAFDYGIVDAIFPAANYLEDSLHWADGVLGGTIKVDRKNEPGKIERLTKWPIAIKMARGMLESRIGTRAAARPTPRWSCSTRRRAARRRRASPARTRRWPTSSSAISSRHPCTPSIWCRSAPSARSARPTRSSRRRSTKVGIIGAGLMASQFALLFVRKLQVPVLITDLDQARVDKGLAYIHDEIGKLEAKGRLDGDSANRLRALVHGTTDKAEYADCDFVIEAVFEEVGVKQAGLRRDRADRRRRRDPRDEHLVAVGRGDRREARPPRASRRLPLLQPGRGHAADRDREDAEDDGCRALDRVRRGARPRQERGAHRRRPRLRRQPAARQGHGRGGARGLRGHSAADGREGLRARSGCR